DFVGVARGDDQKPDQRGEAHPPVEDLVARVGELEVVDQLVLKREEQKDEQAEAAAAQAPEVGGGGRAQTARLAQHEELATREEREQGEEGDPEQDGHAGGSRRDGASVGGTRALANRTFAAATGRTRRASKGRTCTGGPRGATM